MKTWTELKELVERFDNACWSLISTNGSRYNPTLEVYAGYDTMNTNEFIESWHVTLIDEFFPFTTKGETMEETIDKAYGILVDYTTQIETGNITAHYLTGYVHGYERKLRSFSVEDCRYWTRCEIDFEAFPTKELAMAKLAEEDAIKEARNKR